MLSFDYEDYKTPKRCISHFDRNSCKRKLEFKIERRHCIGKYVYPEGLPFLPADVWKIITSYVGMSTFGEWMATCEGACLKRYFSILSGEKYEPLPEMCVGMFCDEKTDLS